MKSLNSNATILRNLINELLSIKRCLHKVRHLSYFLYLKTIYDKNNPQIIQWCSALARGMIRSQGEARFTKRSYVDIKTGWNSEQKIYIIVVSMTMSRPSISYAIALWMHAYSQHSHKSLWDYYYYYKKGEIFKRKKESV
jgi:hypothetical protein